MDEKRILNLVQKEHDTICEKCFMLLVGATTRTWIPNAITLRFDFVFCVFVYFSYFASSIIIQRLLHELDALEKQIDEARKDGVHEFEKSLELSDLIPGKTLNNGLF